MNLRDLEYVLALADKRHFGLAAEACNVSQPALSSQIKKLEGSLGIKLFDRTPAGVVPTAQAAYVIDAARLIIDKAADIRRYAKLQGDAQQPKILHLGVIPTIAPYYLAEFFEQMKEPLRGKRGAKTAAGRIVWQIHEEKTPTLIRQMVDGKIDGAILSLPVDIPDGLKAKVLFEEPFYLAVPAGHSHAALKQADAKSLPHDEWLLLDEGHCLKDQVLELCTRVRGPLSQSFRATSLETLRHMVASASGITLMPEMARRRNDGITYVPFNDKKFCRAIGLVWRKNGFYADKFEEMATQLHA